MNALNKLNLMRQAGGSRRTVGLPDATIERFLKSDPLLAQSIDEAYAAFEAARAEFPELIALDEHEQLLRAQAGSSISTPRTRSIPTSRWRPAAPG